MCDGFNELEEFSQLCAQFEIFAQSSVVVITIIIMTIHIHQQLIA